MVLKNKIKLSTMDFENKTKIKITNELTFYLFQKTNMAKAATVQSTNTNTRKFKCDLIGL